MAEVVVSKAFERSIPESVTATKAVIVNFLMSFEHSRGFVEVSFEGASGDEYHRETWVLRGATLNSALGRAPVGVTSVAVIEETLEFMVNFIENTVGKKQELIDIGQLLVRQGSLFNTLNPGL